ncbi:hypothetical protein IVB46_33255 [Bradyrhizobium sp. 61]|uniref:hypothetical protein n=1 Tax=Bradyrhizobium sp. 61 TaxID=2782679 RepID=UPI001FF79B58|nr:hypothetical protein [Bradyrhizobium sp. 61]MCK1280102.1 hypothetical protein [Bradyrhizobium sp. 61]
MTKIYPYADQSQVDLFHQYSAALGLNAASLLRMLLVRRVRPGGLVPQQHADLIENRTKIPVDLPPDLYEEVARYALQKQAPPAEIAAQEMLFELQSRSLERFLLGNP